MHVRLHVRGHEGPHEFICGCVSLFLQASIGQLASGQELPSVMGVLSLIFSTLRLVTIIGPNITGSCFTELFICGLGTSVSLFICVQ